MADINGQENAVSWQSHKADFPHLDILVRSATFLLARLPATETVPNELLADLTQAGSGQHLYSLTRTQDELSILVSLDQNEQYTDAETRLRTKYSEMDDTAKHGYGIDGPWRCLRVRGPMQFHLVGVMFEITKSLAAGGVSIFALSTWDTDYVLVKSDKLDAAVSCLRTDGWNVLL